MAQYRVTSPDGQTYNVTGPDGATDDQVLAQVHDYTNPQPKAPGGQLGKLAGKAAAEPRPDRSDSEMTDFIAGNLNKGVAMAAGAPVDTAQNVYNLGKAAVGTATGRPQDFPLVEGTPGGSQSIENLMRQGGMIRPGADPTSSAGAYAARALQFIPGAMVGRPSPGRIPSPPTSMMQRATQPIAQTAQYAAPRVGAAVSSGLASQAGEDIAGPVGGMAGAMLPGAGAARNRGAGERATAERQSERFGKAKDMGIPIPPREMKPDVQQQSIQDKVTQTLGVPRGTEIEGKMLDNLRKSHYDDYLAIIKEPSLGGKIQSTPSFQKEVQDMATSERRLRREFPDIAKDKEMQSALSNFAGRTEFTAEGAMRIVQRLRNMAQRNLGVAGNDQSAQLGHIQKGMASAMESLIEENLQRTGKPELMERFRKARTAIAMSHDVEAALDPKTRKIDAGRLSALMTEGKPLSGGLRDIGEVAGQFPGAMKEKPEGDMFTQRMSTSALRHPGAAVAHGATRLMDPITTSRPYQALFVDPATKLKPEQEQALRLLLSIEAGQQGQIARPPEQ